MAKDAQVCQRREAPRRDASMLVMLRSCMPDDAARAAVDQALEVALRSGLATGHSSILGPFIVSDASAPRFRRCGFSVIPPSARRSEPPPRPSLCLWVCKAVPARQPCRNAQPCRRRSGSLPVRRSRPWSRRTSGCRIPPAPERLRSRRRPGNARRSNPTGSGSSLPRHRSGSMPPSEATNSCA